MADFRGIPGPCPGYLIFFSTDGSMLRISIVLFLQIQALLSTLRKQQQALNLKLLYHVLGIVAVGTTAVLISDSFGNDNDTKCYTYLILNSFVTTPMNTVPLEIVKVFINIGNLSFGQNSSLYLSVHTALSFESFDACYA